MTNRRINLWYKISRTPTQELPSPAQTISDMDMTVTCGGQRALKWYYIMATHAGIAQLVQPSTRWRRVVCFTPPADLQPWETPGTYLTRGLVSPRRSVDRVDVVEKRKTLSLYQRTHSVLPGCNQWPYRLSYIGSCTMGIRLRSWIRDPKKREDPANPFLKILACCKTRILCFSILLHRLTT